jgi:hypothetical protein
MNPIKYGQSVGCEPSSPFFIRQKSAKNVEYWVSALAKAVVAVKVFVNFQLH